MKGVSYKDEDMKRGTVSEFDQHIVIYFCVYSNHDEHHIVQRDSYVYVCFNDGHYQ